MFKWLVKKQLEAFGRTWGYDTGYVREIVDEAGVGAVMPLQALAEAGQLSQGSARRLLRCGVDRREGRGLRAVLAAGRARWPKRRDQAANDPRDPRARLRQVFEGSAARRRAGARNDRARRHAAKKRAPRFCGAGDAPDSSRSPTPSSVRKPIPRSSTPSATAMRACA